jgi:hypothetical protein
MARGFKRIKGFIQNGVDIATDLDKVVSSLTLGGPTLAAQRVVAELQQEGPSWTGRFSNSWQIQGPQGQIVKGDGQPGEPRPVIFTSAPFTGPQALAVLAAQQVFKDKTVFRISNFSTYAGQATDVEQSNFVRPTPFPTTQLGRQKFEKYEVPQGRVNPSYRWQTGGGSSNSSSSSTADKDWLATYAGGGKLDKAVKIEMDAVLRSLR